MPIPKIFCFFVDPILKTVDKLFQKIQKRRLCIQKMRAYARYERACMNGKKM